MDFVSVLKGRVAERILVTLLERGGYRVTRIGVEELFDEVKYLELPAYLRLGLPEALRALPDLLVADPSVSWARLIEVRSTLAGNLNASVALRLHRQRRSLNFVAGSHHAPCEFSPLQCSCQRFCSRAAQPVHSRASSKTLDRSTHRSLRSSKLGCIWRNSKLSSQKHTRQGKTATRLVMNRA